MKTYEGMFMLDAGNADFEAAAAPVREVLARVEADVLTFNPWEERRLAYEIKGRRRALYVLTYFKAEAAALDNLHHDIQLDERILRALILSADHVSEEKIQALTPAMKAAARKAASEAQKTAKERAAAQAARAGAAGDKAAAAPESLEAPAAEPPPAAETPSAAQEPAPPAEQPPAAPAAEPPPEPAEADQHPTPPDAEPQTKDQQQ